MGYEINFYKKKNRNEIWEEERRAKAKAKKEANGSGEVEDFLKAKYIREINPWQELDYETSGAGSNQDIEKLLNIPEIPNFGTHIIKYDDIAGILYNLRNYEEISDCCGYGINYRILAGVLYLLTHETEEIKLWKN